MVSAAFLSGLIVTAPAQAAVPALPAAAKAATDGCEYRYPRWEFYPLHYFSEGDCHLTDGGYLIMQGDGNLVIYDRNWQPRCSSETFNRPGAFAAFQPDGNFVIYYNGRAIAASGTQGNPNSVMWFRVNGRLQIINAEGHIIWDMCRDGFPLRAP